MTYSADQLPFGLDQGSDPTLDDVVVGQEYGGSEAVFWTFQQIVALVGANAGYAADTFQVQSRRSAVALREDGTFRDPTLLGTGTLSVGTIATITDDTKYNAWPVCCRLRDQRIALAYTKGDSHHGDNTGKAVWKTGVENLDGTVTWSSESTIYDDPSKWVSVLGITQLSTGRIIATFFRDTFGSAGSGESGYAYSDDDGSSWSGWVDLHTPSGFTRESYCSGAAIELNNGDVLIPIEGNDSGQTFANQSIKVVRSTDGGDTFGSPVYVHDYTDDTQEFYETTIGYLRDGSILALHRDQDASPGQHYFQVSTDGGATWTSPDTAFLGYGKPNFIQTSTGTIVALTRRNSTAALTSFTSTDDGATWGSAVDVDATMTESEYGCPIELLNGKIMALYGSQPSASTTNADIKSGMLTESTERAGPGLSDGDKGDITVSSGGTVWTIDQTAVKPTECIAIACSDETTALTTGTAKVTFRMPYAFTVTDVRASVTTAPTGTGNLTIDINEAGSTILSTKLTFDASEKTTTTAATPAVISDSSLADDAEMTIDIDAVSGTITGAGLKVYIIGHRT